MDIGDLLPVLRAAAEPTRLRLLMLCARAQLTVSELTQILGQSQPRVSRHLKLLCDAGLLDRIREGSWVFYGLTAEGPAGALARALVDQVSAADSTAAQDVQRLDSVKHARSDAVQAYFSANAGRWAQIRSLHVEEREVERVLLDMLPEGAVHELLDIGTGTGRIVELFGRRVERAVGIDLSRDMLAVARANLARADLGNCQVRHGDMYRLPWPDAAFDAVTIHQVLHFAEEPREAIAEAARVLRPGGRLAVVDFAPHQLEYLRIEHAHRRLGLADAEVIAWCRAAGLAVERTEHLPGLSLTVTVWLARRPAARRAAEERHHLPVRTL